jgi:Resolvase, N terminal domain/Recombinase
VRPQTGSVRSALAHTQRPSGDATGQKVDLLALFLLAAAALAAASLAHALARRRAFATHRQAVTVPAGGVIPGTTPHRPVNQAGARLRRPAQEDKQQDPSSPPLATPRLIDADEVNAVRAVGYVTGADPEALTGPDIHKQIAAIDEVCSRRGWELTEIVRDVTSRTGRGTGQGLSYALGRLALEKPACLVVAELGRLSESAAELAQIVRSLRERDIALLAINADLDTSTNEGRLAADALISVGELGHRSSSQPAVHDLPALRKHIVTMRSSGMTLQAIADRLNAEGVPTLRGGKLWRPSSVQVALGYRRPGQGRTGSLPKTQSPSGREWR